MRYVATPEDRRHFCTYDEAQAAIVDVELPFRSNGETHVAFNVTTGHRIPCADAYMAFGYVAGSSVLFPHWKFVIQMGAEQVGPFAAHPKFNNRIDNPNWREIEDAAKRASADDRLLRQQAQAAYDAVMARGVIDDDF